MFIIAPKHRAPQNLAAAAEEEDRGPVRTVAACDSCRAKKIKCNSGQPCGPCRRRRIICVYSRPTTSDTPLSPAQAALLKHQQFRLHAAVQKMASIIARNETGHSQDPKSFDVLEQLDKYAPDLNVENDRAPNASSPGTASQCLKRRRVGELRRTAKTTQTASGLANDTESSSDLSFAIQPSASFNPAINEHTQAYHAMMQYFQSIKSPDNAANAVDRTQPTHPVSSQPSNALLMQPNTSLSSDQMDMDGFLGDPSVPPFDFLNMVDWDATLQQFQNSDNLFSIDDSMQGVDQYKS